MTHPKRILVYGVTGSGKSTLARQLAESLGLPYYSVDDISHLANWVQAPLEDQRQKIGAICDTDEWILDGAYASWKDLVLPKADLIVALDYPRYVSLFRLTRRCIQRAIDQKPICNGNTESWRLMFSKQSIILWHFKSFPSKRTRIRHWATASNMPPLLRLTSLRQTRHWQKNGYRFEESLGMPKENA